MTEKSPLIRSLLEKGVADGVFSGAALCVATQADDLLFECAGTVSRDSAEPIDSRTLFDIASITKLFTASTVLRMVSRGELSLHMSLGELSAGLFRPPFDGATLEQLLSHEAGFVAWRPFFEGVPLPDRGTERGRAAVVEAASRVPPQRASGLECEYSDVGFILLGAALEEIAGVGLDAVVAREVLEPLGLSRTSFRPLDCAGRPVLDDRAPIVFTEDCPWRGRVLRGEVHDDNAWTMGAVAGHAGIFSTAVEVARFGAAWLGAVRGGGWIDSRTARRAVLRRALGRGLGWDMVSPAGSSAGEVMSRRAFGHLGFTGCSLWVDPEAEVSVALLTNRVHPARTNTAIRRFRPTIHDLLMRSLGGRRPLRGED